MKDNTSACYVNYKKDMDGNTAIGPYTYEVIIYGSPNGLDGTFVDCTRYSSGGALRTPAIVTKGTEGLIRQDVKEMFGGTAFGQIYGRARSSSDSGMTVTGKWSVDSIDYGYTYYNRIA